MAVLKKGSKGKKVEDVQHMLNKVKAKPQLEPDGKFGKNTEKAVKYFQVQKKLVDDGKVGDNTLAALKRASGGPGGGAVDGDLQKRFDALYERMRKQLVKDANQMFIVKKALFAGPASCKRIGTEYFLEMIPKLERMIRSAENISKKQAGFAKLLDEDAKLFAQELKKEPEKAHKRFLVVENKEKQIGELLDEFRTATADWLWMHDEIRDGLRGKGPGGKGKDDPGAGDPRLVKEFAALHKKLHKELKSNAHLMFITMQSLKFAPESCERIGTEHFTDMIPSLKRMRRRGAAITKKNSAFLKLLDEDKKHFAREIVHDPAKAQKRFLVVRNKEKQIDELDSEFQQATEGFRSMYEEIQKELRKRRRA